MTPHYSICICNYNMANTLPAALDSILAQCDERFELVIVDDGSTDQSVPIIEDLQKKYQNLRLIQLKRDRKRRLGETRNISIREARGEYVLLHLDCDDIWEPYIIDFAKAFHQIEAAAGRDFFVQGQHIAMARREFLLTHGPYENMYRGEDRNLWAKMAAINSLIMLEHLAFYKRLPRSKTSSLRRSLWHTWDHLENDFRSGAKLSDVLASGLYSGQNFGWKLRIARFVIAFPAWASAKTKPKIFIPDSMKNPENYKRYAQQWRGNLEFILQKFGQTPKFDVFSVQARRLFSS